MKRLLYILIFLAIGNTALAQSFTVEASYNSGTKKTTFTITRSGTSLPEQTINYRTVNLSAYAGQHYTAVNGSYTFQADETTKTVEVSESAPGTNYYKYQTLTDRSYRFEVLDQWGFCLTFCNRSFSTGTIVPSSGAFSVKDVTIQSDEYTADDDGYDVNGYKSVASSSYFNNAAPKAYYQLIGAELRMTLSLQAKENDDAYEYLQLLVDNTSTCDNRDKCSNGDPGNISLSKYMAGFEMNTGSKDATYRSYTFPVLSADHNEGAEDPWGYGDKWPLKKQKFNGNRSTDGRIIIPTGFNTLVLRLNASGGSGSDEWAAKNVKAHIQAVDGTAPAIVSTDAITVSAGSYNRGNEFYISVPFKEIVTITGVNRKLMTEWGNAFYESGYGTNVLTFKGTINCLSGTTLKITGFEGTIADLAGNIFSGSLNKTFTGVTSSDPSYTINYTYNGGGTLSGNPTSYKWSSDDITLAKPYKIGYWFNGWTGSNGDSPKQSITIAKNSHGDKSYTANWTQEWTGSGTQGDPYEITSITGLNLLAMYVNGLDGYSAHDCNGLYFQLGSDITYTPNLSWNSVNSTETNYTPIGTSAYPFRGTFDGQGNTISGIRIFSNGSSATSNKLGLFGDIGEGATIRRTILANARITGWCSIAGIAGHSYYGTVEDCVVADNVCLHSTQAQSSASDHGGIVGFNQGNIYRCISKATLTVANSSGCQSFGAITGYSAGPVQNCIAFGATIPDVTEAGALIGADYDNSLFNNYYRSCSVAGVSDATGVGVGYSSAINSPHDVSNSCGALPLYRLSLPDGVSLVRSAEATLPGTGNATYTTGADIDGTPYAYATATLSISYAGEAAPTGYRVSIYVNGVLATDNGNGTYTATMPADDAAVTTGHTPVPWSGSGSQGTPYIIQYPSQLDLLATRVNGGTNYNGKFFELANDISYAHTTAWDDANSTENNYTAIGDDSHYFQGSFNGRGYTISGIRIYDDNGDGDKGLFGCVGGNGKVRNVKLADTRITGNSRVGGVVGNSTGIIENCHATATVCIHAVQNISSHHGGIVGYASASSNSSILGCTSAAKLTVKDGVSDCFNWGGIVGVKSSGSSLLNNLAIGVELPSGIDWVGAIAGSSSNNSGIARNFFRDCTIGGSAATVGYTYDHSNYSPAGCAEPAYTVSCDTGITVTATGSNYASYGYDGLTVYDYGNDHYGITYADVTYYAQDATVTLSGTGSAPVGYQEPFLGYNVNGVPFDGNSFEMPAADATVTARWTVLDFTAGHAGTEADPYIIYFPWQLDQLAANVNGGTSYSGKFFKLGADVAYDPDNLDANGENYTPIGCRNGNTYQFFSGTFDGDGHTISGIRINKDEANYYGIFGAISDAVVKNLTVSDAHITAYSYFGGIVGYNSHSTIENCHATESVIISGSSGAIECGGIAGSNDNSGTIRGCTSAATLSAYCMAGGIAGYSSASTTIENCLVIGASVTVEKGGWNQRGGAIAGNASSNNGSYRTILSHNYYSNCTVTMGTQYSTDIGVGSLPDGTFDCTDVNSTTILDNPYIDCAVRAETSLYKPAEIGAQIASYPGGLTVYEHGAYYNGTYYIRHDLDGTASALTLVQGTKDGTSAYWGTYFDSTTNYELSEGAAAYTLGTDYKLYRLGTNGRTIPKNTAVVIIAASDSVTLVPAGTGDLGITDNATGGNQLQGSDSEVLVSGLSGTPYVLSRSAGVIGFRQFSGASIPAEKAYYVVATP